MQEEELRQAMHWRVRRLGQSRGKGVSTLLEAEDLEFSGGVVLADWEAHFFF